ncbi:hypothetical protein [Solemya elarraichensis gill symbiont]|nr:hypothetical protein [Solemya elarraichensis gill symbiont]
MRHKLLMMERKPRPLLANHEWDIPDDANASLRLGIGFIQSVMDEATHEYVDGGNRLAMRKIVT